jgi:Domain of unknown function (DUF4440)
MGLNFKHRNSHPRLKPFRALRLLNGLVAGPASLVRPMGLLLMMACPLPVLAQESNQGGTAAAIRALEHEWAESQSRNDNHALEHEWAEGQSRNDNHALDLIFDNFLVYVEYGKLVTKSEYLLRIKDAGPQLSQVVLEPMTVRTFGSTAIVIGTYRERDVNAVTPRPRRWRFVDTWVYNERGWVLVAAAAAPLTEK